MRVGCLVLVLGRVISFNSVVLSGGLLIYLLRLFTSLLIRSLYLIVVCGFVCVLFKFLCRLCACYSVLVVCCWRCVVVVCDVWWHRCFLAVWVALYCWFG